MAFEPPKYKRVTREELYELVWQQPPHTLAATFGISDVALHKRCVRMRIPTPGRGYWAKKEAGKAPPRPRLPKLPDSSPEYTKVAVFDVTPKPPTPPPEVLAGPIVDQQRFEDDPEHRIVVPELLTDPHPLVASSVHLLRRSRTNAQHLLVPSGKKCLAVSVSLDTVDRAMLILDTLIKAAEERGFSVRLSRPESSDEGQYATTITVHDEAIGVSISENVDRTERKPDPKAKYPSYGKQWDYQPTGRLSLQLVLPYVSTRVRGTWSDGTKQRLETLLNEVIVGLVAASEAIKAERVIREERERQYQEEQRRRELAEERRREEAARVRALAADMNRWRRSVIIREYAAALRHSAAQASLLESDSALSQWLDWVERYADTLDPMTGTPDVPADPQPYAWHSGGSPSESEVLW
jgi:hypothetical protein